MQGAIRFISVAKFFVIVTLIFSGHRSLHRDRSRGSVLSCRTVSNAFSSLGNPTS